MGQKMSGGLQAWRAPNGCRRHAFAVSHEVMAKDQAYSATKPILRVVGGYGRYLSSSMPSTTW